MAHRLFQAGVKAVISDESAHVLLLKAASGHYDAHWDLPGGRIEDTQTAEEALRRELQEETGITEVSDIRFNSSCISNHELRIEHLGRIGLVLMAYDVRVPSGTAITLSDEHTDYEWVPRLELAVRLKDKYPVDFCEALASV